MSTLREEWLTKAKDLIVDQVFTPHELRFPPLVKVSVAILTGKYLGVCCNPEFSDEGAINIFISAGLGNDDVMDILGTLTHELCRANLYGEGYPDHSHGPQFVEVSNTVGLEGRPKSRTAIEGTELYATLQGIAATLGVYPHMPIRKKPTKTRQSETLTWVSETDPEYTIKAKYSMTEEKGAPRDFNSQPMVVKDLDKLAILQEMTAEEIASGEETL